MSFSNGFVLNCLISNRNLVQIFPYKNLTTAQIKLKRFLSSRNFVVCNILPYIKYLLFTDAIMHFCIHHSDSSAETVVRLFPNFRYIDHLPNINQSLHLLTQNNLTVSHHSFYCCCCIILKCGIVMIAIENLNVNEMNVNNRFN